MKKVFSWLLAIAIVVCLAAPVMAADATQPFDDVSASNRFYKAIMWASNEGIAKGVDDSNFGIGKTCTRGQMVLFLWRFAGQPEPTITESPFTDVSVNNKTYGKAVLWAYENGITKGIGNDLFGLQNTCTRQQAVQFLYNYFGQPYVEGEENFPDVTETNRFYNAIVWAASNGVANGKADGTFDGSGFCKREHIVQFMYNAKPGTKVDPIMVMPESIPYTFTAEIPAGDTMYFMGYGLGGMILIVNGEEVATLEGMGRMPITFPVTNNGETDTCEITLTFPAGHQMNPEVITFDVWETLALEEGDFDGYYYSYTPEADGSIMLYISSITEGVAGDIIVTNMTTYNQKTLTEDGVDNYGLELHMDVVAGEELIIQVLVQHDDNWQYPAAEIIWVGQFSYPEGTEGNPIFVNFDMNEEWTEGTSTVTVPAGQTLYYQCYNAGMIMSINGEEWGTLTASGMGMAPAVFSITNDGTEDAEYVLSVKLPVGEMMNPEVIEFDVWKELSLEANDYDGYYYSYTPEADGSIMLYISSITEGVVGDIIVNNQVTYAQMSLREDGVDNYGLELHMDVVAGEELIIQVVVVPDENWNVPAADIIWVGQFSYPEGTEGNPIFVNFEMNEEWTEGTATVTVPAGQTLYYQCYNDGMIMSINGEEWGTLTASGMGMAPAVFSITNDGTEDAEYVLSVKLPVGAMMNPEVIDLDYTGNVSFEANNFDGYHYSYTADADQTIVFSVSSVTEGAQANIIVTNQTSYAQSSLSEDGVDGVLTVDVLAGEELVIQVVVMPDENWNYPAADISWTAEAVVAAPTDPVEIVEAAYALENGGVLPYTATLTGVITEIKTPYNSSYKNISVVIAVEGAEDKPILCYRLIDNSELSLEYSVADLIVGDIITVTGNIKNHNGTIEFDAKCTLDAIEKAEGEVPVAPENPADIVAAAYALEKGESLPYSATLTGEITIVNQAYSSQYKNITVTITVAGCEDFPIECYRMKGTGADVIAVGDTITVTGTLKNFNGKIEFDTGCSLDSYVKGEEPEIPGEIETPENVPTIYAPEEDTAYKFGLYQVINGATLYVTGEVSGRYLSTTSDVAAAADVYVEAVEGGYLFYILVEGEKSYIQVYLNESSKISVQFAAEGSVFAYDSNKFCWATNVSGTDYYLGTYSTFGTISASKTSFIDAGNAGINQFPAGFFIAE